MEQLPLIVGALAVGVLGLYMMYGIHLLLNYHCLWHARRFCGRNGLEIRRSRWRPAFEPSGIKTEFTLVELDCVDIQRQRRLVRLLVWAFGIHKVLTDGSYPDSFDEQWPKDEQKTA